MIYIALGANMPSVAGPPAATLRQALAALPAAGIVVEAVSPFYHTPSWPDPSQPAFVNAMARVRTRLGPWELMRTLLAIERQFGRVRKTRWEPRTLDLDLIDYGGLILDETLLMLPHPRVADRAFVLRPLADIAPGWRHPDTGQTVEALLEIVGEAGIERLAGA